MTHFIECCLIARLQNRTLLYKRGKLFQHTTFVKGTTLTGGGLQHEHHEDPLAEGAGAVLLVVEAGPHVQSQDVVARVEGHFLKEEKMNFNGGIANL